MSHFSPNDFPRLTASNHRLTKFRMPWSISPKTRIYVNNIGWIKE